MYSSEILSTVGPRVVNFRLPDGTLLATASQSVIVRYWKR
jgi:hypothetical protein